MLLVHKSRRTSSRVFQPLSFFASPFVGSWYERFSTNDKRNYFFSWNNIWSWPLCYCFSLIAGHNKTGLFFVCWNWLVIAARNCHIVVVLTAHLGVSSAGFKGIFFISSLSVVLLHMCQSRERLRRLRPFQWIIHGTGFLFLFPSHHLSGLFLSPFWFNFFIYERVELRCYRGNHKSIAAVQFGVCVYVRLTPERNTRTYTETGKYHLGLKQPKL